MLTPAPSAVVGAAVVKRFPGYGVHRGSIVEIDGNRVVVHWAATDERTTLTLKEAAKRVVASPLADEEDDDDQSVTSTALGIESSATSFTGGISDLTATTSKFWGVSWKKRERRWQAQYKDKNGKPRYIGLYDTQEAAAHAVNAAIRRAGLEGRRMTNPVVDGQLVPRALKAPGHGPRYKRRRDEPAAAASPRARRR